MKTAPSPPAVVVVADAPDAQRRTRDALAEAGYAVLEVTGGSEALHLLAGADAVPELLVVDLAPPGMKAWAFLDILRSYNRLARIPALVLSDESPAPQTGGAGRVVVLSRSVPRAALLAAAEALARPHG